MAEEDGDIVESWEELEDNVALEKKLKEMKPRKKANDSTPNYVIPARLFEDSTRTPFTPQVKILKREPNANNADSANKMTQAKPTKTLEQREAEYAEARLRILGQDYVSNNPNDKEDAASNQQPGNSVNSNSVQAVGAGAGENGVQTKTESEVQCTDGGADAGVETNAECMGNSANGSEESRVETAPNSGAMSTTDRAESNNVEQIEVLPIDGGAEQRGIETYAESQYELIPQFGSMNVTENIVRQPRGPDGSRGFTPPNNARR